jgi:hypothetical protein
MEHSGVITTCLDPCVKAYFEASRNLEPTRAEGIILKQIDTIAAVGEDSSHDRMQACKILRQLLLFSRFSDVSTSLRVMAAVMAALKVVPSGDTNLLVHLCCLVGLVVLHPRVAVTLLLDNLMEVLTRIAKQQLNVGNLRAALACFILASFRWRSCVGTTKFEESY